MILMDIWQVSYYVIKQYYDLFVHVCNEINSNNREETLSQYHQSDTETDYLQLLAAIKKLLLRGNIGKASWFSTSQIGIRSFHN